MTADIHARLRTRVAVLEQDAAQANAALDRVRAIHRDAYPGTADTGRSCTAGCGTWPCATLTALDPAQQPTTETPEVTVHACPGPDDNGISPCCKRPPFEFRGERITSDPEKVTCPGPTQQSTI